MKQKLINDLPKLTKEAELYLLEQGTWRFDKRYPQFKLTQGELHIMRARISKKHPSLRTGNYFAIQKKRHDAYEQKKMKLRREPERWKSQEEQMAHFRKEYEGESKKKYPDYFGVEYPFNDVRRLDEGFKQNRKTDED